MSNPITIPKLRTRQLRYDVFLYRSVGFGVFVIQKLFNVNFITYLWALHRERIEMKMIRSWFSDSQGPTAGSRGWEYSKKITN